MERFYTTNDDAVAMIKRTTENGEPEMQIQSRAKVAATPSATVVDDHNGVTAVATPGPVTRGGRGHWETPLDEVHVALEVGLRAKPGSVRSASSSTSRLSSLIPSAEAICRSWSSDMSAPGSPGTVVAGAASAFTESGLTLYLEQTYMKRACSLPTCCANQESTSPNLAGLCSE